MSAVLKEGAEEQPLAFCYQVNGSCPRTVRPLGVQLTIYLICAAGTIITVLGNLFVVFTVSYFKALHTPTNFLLLSLALADMLLGLLVLPLSTVRSVESCWFFGDSICRLHTYLDTLFCLTPSPISFFSSYCSCDSVCPANLYSCLSPGPILVLFCAYWWSFAIHIILFSLFSSQDYEILRWLQVNIIWKTAFPFSAE